ncbi:MAG: UDP-N-acetylmuramoyl-tripeptide--D-alanyl-D-alanine ligase [Propionibacteriaceae bacterium]|jgi:UDP-N-acetylmuramoyl-tripeptide--D-alanyl-D-alanine ligase|nr:UDP-N-acetylmuramoyl-tripeptide--D-alanyl-D-alanine ligase [Propionibacteriaceae bacterium]
MLARKASEIAALVGGELRGPDTQVGPDVCIDSRNISAGALFVALKGERSDGHAYVADALDAGAGAALVERSSGKGTEIVVADVLAAFQVLGRALVEEGKERGMIALAITGSNGKTSTKDLLAQILEQVGPTVSPEGSYNNEIGVPLTACRIGADTRFLVAEMGARALGDITALTEIVPPDIGAVLNVGVSHIGEFGSVEAIAQAKGELAEAAGEWAVLNADDPRVAAMETNAKRAMFSVIGEPEGSLRVWATEITADENQRCSFVLHAARHGDAKRMRVAEPRSMSMVKLQLPGRHQVANAVAAAAAALATGELSVKQVAAGLSAAKARSHWRMELGERDDGLRVLNDSYNANPVSMRAALDALEGMRRQGGRLIAVLGEMLELGPDAAVNHYEIGMYAALHGVDIVIAVAGHCEDLAQGAFDGGAEGIAVADGPAALDVALRIAAPQDVVLVKASRGIALEHVAFGLLEGNR